MLKSIYTPLSGALAQEKVMDIIANNLANLNTVGFKGEAVTFKAIEPEPEKNYRNPLPPANYKISLDDVLPLRGNDLNYVGVSEVRKDFSQGPAIQTNNPLDLMLEGEGFFAVQTEDGLRYTRSGDFTMSENGALVDKVGNPVLGQKGNIFIRHQDFEVNPLGEVYQDGQLVDRLLIYKFDNPDALEKVGMNHFFYEGMEGDPKIATDARVQQGSLEGSNVNAIRNLTALILSHRSFEAYQKSIKNYDSMMEKSSNSIGEVRA
jgi:flagellar basal-body rod protein FlgG